MHYGPEGRIRERKNRAQLQAKSRDRGVARGTMAILDLVLEYGVAPSFNQELTALVAIGTFISPSRHVSLIDIAETGSHANYPSAV